MSLKPGEVQADGAIVGRRNTRFSGDRPAMQDVVAALQEHHDIQQELDEESFRWSGYMRMHQETEPVLTEQATVVRVLNGCVMVTVDGVEYHLDYAEWIFIPVGKIYKVSNTLLAGPVATRFGRVCLAQ